MFESQREWIFNKFNLNSQWWKYVISTGNFYLAHTWSTLLKMQQEQLVIQQLHKTLLFTTMQKLRSYTQWHTKVRLLFLHPVLLYYMQKLFYV